jgi:hypothetical protein
MIEDRLPVGVSQRPKPHLQNLIVMFQDAERFFDKAG